MTKYRLPAFDLSSRVQVALEMLQPIPERRWGRVTELSQSHGVSRTRLYEIRDAALDALTEALSGHPAGRPVQSTTLRVDKAFIDRTIATLPMLTGSVRGIQQGLDLLFGVSRSVGYISQTLQTAGAQAEAYHLQMTVPLPVLGEADEIFQGRRPCLTVVDGRSFLVLHLAPAEARDATTWGVTLLDLAAQGIVFQDLATDGGTGLLAGVRETKLAIPLRPDLFHLVREAHRVGQRLERAAYRAIDQAERARRAEREAQAPQRRRGRKLKIKVPRVQAEAQEAQTIATVDLFVWLWAEIRQALEPITSDGQVASVAQARATVETAIELLVALNQPDITTSTHKLAERLDDVLSPLAWLEQALAPWRRDLDAPTERLIVWAWQHRQTLALAPGEGFPATLQPIVQAVGEALSLFHRSSSLAESLHSWLRPHLAIHRGMPQWLLPLLQLFWNHHSFSRGKRVGQTPLQLAGVADAPCLHDVLQQLFGPQPVAQPA